MKSIRRSRRRSPERSDVGRPKGDGENAPNVASRLQSGAFELFARQTYSNVSIKDIADATGFTPSLIYYYFGSKEGLFMQVVEATVASAFEHFAVITEKAETPEDLIGLWIELHIEQYANLQKLAKISFDYANTHARSKQVDAAIQKFYDKEAAFLGQAIRDGIEAGTFKDVNPEETAMFISTFLDGTLFRNVMFPDFDPAKAIRHMRAVVLRHLRK